MTVRGGRGREVTAWSCGGGHGHAIVAWSCGRGHGRAIVVGLTTVPEMLGALESRYVSVRFFQSMFGLTLSSQGIPKIIWLEPRGATRKISWCSTPPRVNLRVTTRFAWINLEPFTMVT